MRKKKITGVFLMIGFILVLSACGSKTQGEGAFSQSAKGAAESGASSKSGSASAKGAGKDADVPKNGVEIASAEDLLAFRDRVNAGEDDLNAVLTADIDLSGVCGEGVGDWVSIGITDGEPVIYEGTFDGGGHTISGLYGTDHDRTVGLFSGLGSDSTVRGLTMTELFIDTEHGGAIAHTIEGRVENCNVNGQVTGLQVGGLAWEVGETGVLTGCSYAGSVNATSHAGGLIWQSIGLIEQCRNEADVFCVIEHGDGAASGIVSFADGMVSGCTNSGKITGNLAAGIAAQSEALIQDCLNEGDVIGQQQAGGIGCVYTDKEAFIDRCRNTGSVSGGMAAAGIAINCRTYITNCFHKGTICAGLNHINDLFGASGLEDFMFSETTLSLSNKSRAAGLVCYGVGAVNCYTQGSIRVASQEGLCEAFGLISLLDADSPMVANCYTNAELSSDDRVYGIGIVGEPESCYYSELTASAAGRKEDGPLPSGAESFTDGTITDALNQWMESAGGDYWAWKQGETGPCFEWE